MSLKTCQATVHQCDTSGIWVPTVHQCDTSGIWVPTGHQCDTSGIWVPTGHQCDTSGIWVPTVHQCNVQIHACQARCSVLPPRSALCSEQPAAPSPQLPHKAQRCSKQLVAPSPNTECRIADADGARAIVLSGGYKDDTDLGATMWYTGQGGQKGKQQVRGCRVALRCCSVCNTVCLGAQRHLVNRQVAN